MAKKRMDKRIVRQTLLYAAVLTLGVLMAEWAGWMQPLERFWYDTRARHFQYFTSPPTDKIVHINIDDPSLTELGRWPWDRAVLAQLVDELKLAGAKVIGFDVILAEPQRIRYEKDADGTFKPIDDDAAFADALRRADNVLIPLSAEPGKRSAPTQPQVVEHMQRFSLPMPPGMSPLLWADSELPLVPQFAEALRYSGVVNFVTDPDGVVRNVPLFINYRGRLMPHMALSAFCAEMGVDPSTLTVTADSLTIPLDDGPRVVPLHTFHSDVAGDVGLAVAVPYQGRVNGKSWETMYDFPAHENKDKQQIPARRVWAIRQTVADLERNKREADDAVRSINSNSLFETKQTTAYLARPVELREVDRQAALEGALKSLTEMGVDETDEDPRYRAAVIALRAGLKDIPAKVRELESARADLKTEVDGRYAVIGYTATGKLDQFPTSLDPLVPGILIQGAVFSALATNQFWKAVPAWTEAMITLLIAGLTTLFVMRLSNWWATGSMLFLACMYLLINGLVLFDYYNYIVPAAGPTVAAALICFGVTVARFIYEQSERSRITRRFSSMVDPALVNHFIENPNAKFDGQIREMTVVFTDLAGFTTISEKLRERTVRVLNRYMRLMMPIIRDNRGYWNKFLGDGIMFFYNALADNPHHARDAVHTVLAMQKVMPKFNEELAAEGLPRVAMRAGISTGEMVVGDAGSDHPDYYASDYTVLGDDVNLGARLESANKALGSRVLMNAGTANSVKDTVLLRPMALLQVVGKTEPVMTYEAMALLSEATDAEKRLAELSARMVDAYLKAQFGQCLELATTIEDEFGSSKYTLLYKNLCREHLANPPQDFTGVVVLYEK